MPQEIVVKRNKEHLFSLDEEVFVILFNNTVVRRKKKFFDAVQKGIIQYDDFINLVHKGDVPYPLFFLERRYVEKIIDSYNKKVYFGVSKEQLSISSRGDITLADIALILKDITRKQSYLKGYITTNNNISGRYTRTNKSITERANEMREFVGYDIEKVFSLKKEDSYNLLDKGLSAHNVFLSLYAHNYTPQVIDKSLQFSGVAINDKKCPFLFIKAGDNDSKIEPWGRRLFTAALLLSCLTLGDCRPVTMDGSCRELIDDENYLFAEEFLMPRNLFEKEFCGSLIDAEMLADKYSVSPSAVIMRLYRLRIIDEFAKNEYLDVLSERWRKLINKKGGGNPLGLEKGINRYNNKAFVQFVITRYKAKKITMQDARNLLCYKKGDRFNVEALKNA